jgi:hypothetical protein
MFRSVTFGAFGAVEAFSQSSGQLSYCIPDINDIIVILFADFAAFGWSVGLKST